MEELINRADCSPANKSSSFKVLQGGNKMNKPFIFVTGVFCGILIFVMTNYITDSLKETLIINSSHPVSTNQVKSTDDQNQTPQPSIQADKTGESPSEKSTDYVRYWESNGIKFKDVGENGIEKTYVWNASLKEWVDTGLAGNINE